MTNFTFWHVHAGPKPDTEACCECSLLLQRPTWWRVSVYELTSTHTRHWGRILYAVAPPWQSYCFCLISLTGAKSCLTQVTELGCHGNRDVAAVGVHLLSKIRPAEHYASTCAASLLLMDINIYMAGRCFHGALWWAQTWWRADGVACVKH